MPRDGQDGEATSLADVIDAIRRAGHGDALSVEDILTEIGDRSFATALLVPALILISPSPAFRGCPPSAR